MYVIEKKIVFEEFCLVIMIFYGYFFVFLSFLVFSSNFWFSE